ncbi:MAG: tRNA uridine-5-carboxymethylaminomethyl(34) synthesis GTPase MnmE [Halioglobus sp.]
MTHPHPQTEDTIAAIATAPGRGGVGIIRLSGRHALTIGQAITKRTLSPRYAHYCDFKDELSSTLDSGIALYFPAPHSFTGEDVVELQAHGGPVILDLILKTIFTHQCRPARPGEFSERAFLNDKLDLTQAEAIADLINSTTETSARNATASLQGAFSREIHQLVEAVIALRVYVEAAIDFPEEEIDFLADGKVLSQLDALLAQVDTIYREARQGTLVQEGMKLVIAGKPNAGKSSLLNQLAGQESAIVTPIEGTTRDVLREHIQIDGMPLHIVDTAGLRESADVVEREGIRRAWQEMETADRILLVIDAVSSDAGLSPHSLWPELANTALAHIPVTLILNKCDLVPDKLQVTSSSDDSVALSAKTGEGIDALREHLKQCMGYNEASAGKFSARRRHLVSIEKARSAMEVGRAQLLDSSAGELLAEDLRVCQEALGEITGTFSSDDLLGEIFSSFCIGK